MFGFIGRAGELKELESQYSKPYPVTFAIYGRRRAGKTALIHEFCSGKPYLFLSAPLGGKAASADDILQVFEKDIRNQLGTDVMIGSFDGVLDVFGSIEGEDRTVIVIDEFPEVVRLIPEAAGHLQLYIDRRMREQNVFLIICGSSVSAMCGMLEDPKGPLFGRFTAKMKVMPLPYREARLFHPELQEEERVRMYAVASGIPMYHILMSGRSFDDAMKSQFLGLSSTMRNEAASLIYMELSPPESYFSILSATGDGAEVAEISSKTGFSKTACQRMLSNLEMLGMVRDDVPYGKVNKHQYRIVDGVIGLYFTVLSKWGAISEEANTDAVYDAMKPDIDTFVGHRFEDICRQFIVSTERCIWLGRWWGKIPLMQNGRPERDSDGRVATESADIDLVAEVNDGQHTDVLAVECKFNRRRCGIRELDVLAGRASGMAPHQRNIRLMLISRSGFTDELEEYVEDHPERRIGLVDMERFCGWAESDDDRFGTELRPYGPSFFVADVRERT